MKITDKMRLDWLKKSWGVFLYAGGEWEASSDLVKYGPRKRTPRQAIDAAIRAEKRRKP